MKKIPAVIMSLCMAVCLCACADGKAVSEPSSAASAEPAMTVQTETEPSTQEQSAEASSEEGTQWAGSGESGTQAAEGDYMLKFIEAGKYTDGKQSIYDDLYSVKVITLYADKTYKMEQWGWDTSTGIWDTYENGEYTLYSPQSDEETGIDAPAYDIEKIDGFDGYYLEPEGSDGEDYTLLLDASTENGGAVVKLRDRQLAKMTGSNEDSVYTSIAYVSADESDTDETCLKVDDVVWVSDSDPDICRLYGYDPDDMADDYAIADNYDDGFSYRVDENTTFSILDYENGGNRECSEDEFMKQLDVPMLAEVTTNAVCVVRIEQEYVP